MPLSRDEINELVGKLKERYKEYSSKHSPVWFDVNAFDQRLLAAIKGRMNMEGFILAEISNFEKIKERYEKKKKQKENSFSKKVDRIIEENNARIKKYPQIIFHSKNGLEISYLYGAMTFLSIELFPVMRIIIADSRLRNILNSLEDRLLFLAEPRGRLHAKRITDHIMLLNRAGVREIEIEKDSNEYLKECAFLLHDIIDFCDGIVDSGRDEWNYPVTFQKLFIDEEKKKRVISHFSDLTGYGAVLKIREYVSGILDDFRLGAFRKID